MKDSTRIILNTLATYSHSLFALFAGLLSSRWVLQALGQSDFGLYSVVGSIILLIAFLNSGLAVGVGRFYAYSIGHGHSLTKEEAINDLKIWFNTAFSIHSVLPLLIVAIGLPVGEYAIHHWLIIPLERIHACIWVFRISFVTALVTVFSVPFTAMYSAHQLITELAFFNILRTCGNLLGAWYLLRVQSDRLIVYAFYMMVLNVGTTCIQIIRAVSKFDACRIRISYLYSKKHLKKLFGFVGWKIFGMSCVVFREQGTPVLINLQFGPLVNAAYGIAQRLSSQATSLATAMVGAFQPALTSAEGKGDRQKVINMSIQTCKFGTMLVLFFVIPMILEMENILHLWLKNPPEFAAGICRWILVMLVVDRMTAGPMLAVNAFGKIAAYELIQGTLLLSALPMMWLFSRLGLGPVAIGSALFISTMLYCLGRLLFSRHLLEFPLGRWFSQVAMPVIINITLSIIVGLCIMSVIEASFFRICLTLLATVVVTLVIGWYFILDKTERFVLIQLLNNIIVKLPFITRLRLKLVK